MGFSKYILLVVSTAVLLAAFSKQSEAAVVGDKLGQIFADGHKQFDIKAIIGGEGNVVIQLAEEGIKELENFASLHKRAGTVGEAIVVLKNGWELTIKMIADALDEAFDLIDKHLGKKVADKDAALIDLINGMKAIKKGIYHSGAPVHSSLGAARLIAKYADKGRLNFAINQIQVCGSALFDALEVAEFFATQGLSADEDEVLQKCLKAAHAAIMSAAIEANTTLVAGAKSAFEYLADADESSIIQHDPMEYVISEKAKEAAATDSDTIDAIAALEAEFAAATKMGISAPILKEVKGGLLEYIQNCAWSVAISYDAIAQAKLLAKTDPEGAIRVIEEGIETAKSILIYGSVKAYEGLGAAGQLSGLMNGFQAAIEIAERSRVEGTRGLDAAKKLAVTGVKIGGAALDAALDSAHIAVEAFESLLFDRLHECRDVAFLTLKPGMLLFKL